ncbi:hypothetical protein CP082626L3_1123A, partial [Chlamydia psittaci 08-2626_L3]
MITPGISPIEAICLKQILEIA